MTDTNDYFHDQFLEDEDHKESEEDLELLTDDDIRQAAVTATDWTTETILSQIRKGNILLNPQFQRRDAWTKKRKSKFIESLILGLPIPQLVFAESKDQRGKYIVLDGKQRLLSITQFAASIFSDEYESLKLNGLEVRQNLNGKTLEDLQEDIEFYNDLSAFENQPIRTVIIKNWQSEILLYHIFLRLNTGSVSLSTQELRQALHPGDFVTFIDKSSQSSLALRDILNNSQPDFRMRDAELLVRYYAFSYFISEYSGNLKVFLDATCKKLNKTWVNLSDQIIKDLSEFESAHEAIRNVFECNAYRKYTPDGFENRFNRAIFDILMYTFRRPTVRNTLESNKSKVVDAFKDLCLSDTDFLSSIERTTKSLTATHTRLSHWCDLLNTEFDLELSVPNIT